MIDPSLVLMDQLLWCWKDPEYWGLMLGTVWNGCYVLAASREVNYTFCCRKRSVLLEGGRKEIERLDDPGA